MIGKVVSDRYEILEKIGSGGMGDVFKAHDRKLDRIVAIKVLKSQYSEDDNFIRKFKRESLAAASISHPNIVSIYDFGTEKLNGVVDHYIVMEYIDGKTLKEVIGEEGKIYPNRALNYTIQIAEALKTAHLKGIVHRDIKAQNIMITRDDRVKVTDFGIARMVDNTTATITSAVMGSVHYFSPEQARGGKVDRRSDIYSLGIVLFEMLTGTLPFDAENPISVALMHVQNKMPMPSAINPTISKSIDDLVAKMTEKSVNKRYDNVNEVIRDIKDILLGRVPGRNTTTRSTTPLNKRQVENAQRASAANLNDKNIQGPSKGPKKNKSAVGTILGVLAAIVLVVSGAFMLPRLFNRDNNIDEQAKIVVPNYVNQDINEAKIKAEIDSLALNVVDVKTEEDKDNNVILEQKTEPGTEVDKGSTIDVVINKKTEKVTVPTLKGKTEEEAQRIIKEFNLVVGKITRINDKNVPENEVIDQVPSEKEEVEPGTKVYLTVSKGKGEEMALVPNLQGQTVDGAKALLEEVGLELGTIGEDYSNKVHEGEVISQSYQSGVFVSKGTKIDIKINKAKDNDEDDDNDDNNLVSKNYRLSLPEDGKTHAIRITKRTGNNEVQVFENFHNFADGSFNFTFEGNVGDVYVIYIDMNEHETITL